MKLYHFTTIDSFAKIWVSKQLRFADAKNLNDIFETYKYFEIHIDREKNRIEECFTNVINHVNNVLSTYKQISFSIDSKKEEGFMSSMMWGQYAHNENGVCIEFDSDRLYIPQEAFQGKINYTYNIPSFNLYENKDEKQLHNYIKRHKRIIFFTKHKHWEHENEYRIVCKDVEFLNIDDAITKVYVFNSYSNNTKIVEKLINDEIDIDFISMYTTLQNEKCITNKSLKEWKKMLEMASNNSGRVNHD